MSTDTRKKSKYRDRIWLERLSQKQSNVNNKTPYDRMQQYWERKMHTY